MVTRGHACSCGHGYERMRVHGRVKHIRQRELGIENGPLLFFDLNCTEESSAINWILNSKFKLYKNQSIASFLVYPMP